MSGLPSFAFPGKHVFLTGGANGIGLCLCRILLRRGASVTLTDVADGDAAVCELEALIKSEQLNSRVRFIKADVTIYKQMAAAVTDAEGTFGPLDCLIPNAGVASAADRGTQCWPDRRIIALHPALRSKTHILLGDCQKSFAGLFLDESLEEVEKVNRVNCMGVIYTLKAGLPGMVRRGSGSVLLMSSMIANAGGFCSLAYAAAKSSVWSIANSLRLELLGTGVSMTIAMPGFMDTAMRKYGLDNPRSPEIAKQFTRELVVHPPEAVGELAVRAIETGRFIARLPDFHSNFIVASSAGVAPRMFPIWLEFLLLPLYFYLHLWLRRMMDRRILAWRRQEAAALAGVPEGRAAQNGSLETRASRASAAKTK